MEHKAQSIRPFIGSKNFELSRRFYRDLGFQDSILSSDMSYFKTEGLGFYLQDAYVKDWIDKTIVFMEVDDVNRIILKKDCKAISIDSIDNFKVRFSLNFSNLTIVNTDSFTVFL